MRLRPPRIMDSRSRSEVSVFTSSNSMPPDWSNVAISLALVRGKGERVDGRHLAGCKRATELRYLPLLFGALSFRALDSFLQLLLERGQDLIPALGLLLVLLIAVQPKRSIGAQEKQEE